MCFLMDKNVFFARFAEKQMNPTSPLSFQGVVLFDPPWITHLSFRKLGTHGTHGTYGTLRTQEETRKKIVNRNKPSVSSKKKSVSFHLSEDADATDEKASSLTVGGSKRSSSTKPIQQSAQQTYSEKDVYERLLAFPEFSKQYRLVPGNVHTGYQYMYARGGHGWIYRAQDRHTNEWVACKVASSETSALMNQERTIQSFLRTQIRQLWSKDPNEKTQHIEESLNLFRKVYGPWNMPEQMRIAPDVKFPELHISSFLRATLYEYFSQVPFDKRTAAAFVQLVRAGFRVLQWLHECGVVHRDLSPMNLALEVVHADQETPVDDSTLWSQAVWQKEKQYTPVVRLFDYGLAVQFRSGKSKEKTVQPMGSVLYSSLRVSEKAKHPNYADDAEAWIFICCWIWEGSLPWFVHEKELEEFRTKPSARKQVFAQIAHLKRTYTPSLPLLQDALRVVRSTVVDALPDYSRLLRLS